MRLSLRPSGARRRTRKTREILKMKNKIHVAIAFCTLVFFIVELQAGEGTRIFKQIDRGEQSFYMELLIDNPTKQRLEKEIQALLKKYSGQKSLQIDIFDNLEALQRRGDEGYPARLVYKHWLISITDKEVYRFYLKERPDIK
jgi:hypothetical protein